MNLNVCTSSSNLFVDCHEVRHLIRHLVRIVPFVRRAIMSTVEKLGPSELRFRSIGLDVLRNYNTFPWTADFVRCEDANAEVNLKFGATVQ